MKQYLKTQSSFEYFASFAMMVANIATWCVIFSNKKTLMLKSSSKEVFETSFKTASSVRKKIQNWTVSLMYYCTEINRIKVK